MNFPQYSLAENYDARQKERYLALLPQLGSGICFEDDTWICDKRIRNNSDPAHYAHIYFLSVPSQYRELAKYFAIIRLLRGDTIRTVRSRVTCVASFTKFLTEHCSTPPISDCDARTAFKLKEHLEQSAWAVGTKKDIWLQASALLKTMDGFNGNQCKNPFSSNPYARSAKLDYKYISEEIAGKLDTVFRKEEIELHIRCVYWILRLIPSRISEVLAMKIDCVKPYNGNFVIFIPTWKQNGGNMEPILRSIHVENMGIAAYLLELLWKQQKVATKLQSLLPENKQGCLFSYQRILHYKKGGISQAGVANNMIQSFVEYHFKRICREYNILDADGSVYNLTSHKFRHNGITDRLEAGFTMEQIADMTGHHGNAMIWNAYTHLNLKPETIVKKQRCVLEEPLQTESKYILFGGRILGMEELLEKRLLKNLRAHRVPGGICGDVTSCKSDMWNCLSCEHFIPDCSQITYFEEQVSSWQVKAKRFEQMPMVRDNAIKNAGLFEAIVKKIRLENTEDE